MADGRTRLAVNPSVRIDGTENPLEQTTVVTDSSEENNSSYLRYRLALRYQRIDKNNARYVMKQNGKVVQAGERILSDDGKTLTETFKYPDGTRQITLSRGRGCRAPNDAVCEACLPGSYRCRT